MSNRRKTKEERESKKLRSKNPRVRRRANEELIKIGENWVDQVYAQIQQQKKESE